MAASDAHTEEQAPAIERVWAWLDEVADPEIPAVSVLDLGIIRDVRFESDVLVVTMTPTYSGCPALDVIRRNIGEAIELKGVTNYRVDTQLSPPWTTDWITERGRERLRAYGIAPPQHGAEQVIDISRITRGRPLSSPPSCPHCDATDTQIVSQFGSTPCKALYNCRVCDEPFDQFKAH